MLLVVAVVVVVPMVAMTVTWAVAFDGGLPAVIVAAVWAIGGAVLIGSLVRSRSSLDADHVS